MAVLIFALSSGAAMAVPVPQNQSATVHASTVTGRVLDENGEPIIGASVSVKGTKVGTATDIDGKYSIQAPQGSTLIVICVGYSTREVRVNGNN